MPRENIHIAHVSDGYKITISDDNNVTITGYADTFEEVLAALRHYEYDEHGEEYNRHDCPFCRQMILKHFSDSSVK